MLELDARLSEADRPAQPYVSFASDTSCVVTWLAPARDRFMKVPYDLVASRWDDEGGGAWGGALQYRLIIIARCRWRQLAFWSQ